jgi:hypothetical protein
VPVARARLPDLRLGRQRALWIGSPELRARGAMGPSEMPDLYAVPPRLRSVLSLSSAFKDLPSPARIAGNPSSEGRNCVACVVAVVSAQCRTVETPVTFWHVFGSVVVPCCQFSARSVPCEGIRVARRARAGTRRARLCCTTPALPNCSVLRPLWMTHGHALLATAQGRQSTLQGMGACPLLPCESVHRSLVLRGGWAAHGARYGWSFVAF